MNDHDELDGSALDALIDADNFVDFVGERLRDYAGGAGGYAPFVLDRIQAEYLKFWTIPEGDNDE